MLLQKASHMPSFGGFGLRQRRNLLLRAKSAAQETVDAGKVEQTSREVVLG